MWTLLTVPLGSAAVVPAGSPLGFQPDLPGVYVLVVAGTKHGVVRTGTFAVTAIEAEVLSARVTTGAVNEPSAFGIRAGDVIAGLPRDVGMLARRRRAATCRPH